MLQIFSADGFLAPDCHYVFNAYLTALFSGCLSTYERCVKVQVDSDDGCLVCDMSVTKNTLDRDGLGNTFKGSQCSCTHDSVNTWYFPHSVIICVSFFSFIKSDVKLMDLKLWFIAAWNVKIHSAPIFSCWWTAGLWFLQQSQKEAVICCWNSQTVCGSTADHGSTTGSSCGLSVLPKDPSSTQLCNSLRVSGATFAGISLCAVILLSAWLLCFYSTLQSWTASNSKG